MVSCSADLGPRQARFTIGGLGGEAELEATAVPLKIDDAPALERGPEGTWDSVDVLNPSVVFGMGKYLNLYSGYDGTTWRTGLAVSGDTKSWRKFEDNPVLEPDPATWEGDYIAANGSLVMLEREFLYLYHSGPRNQARIGLARTKDVREWTKHPEPVLEPGPPGSWDDTAVADPYVIARKGWLYLFYLGQNADGVQRIGLARSEDGVLWCKSHANPVLEVGGPRDFDANGLGEPAVVASRGRLLMLYTGRAKDERRTLGWAISSDGVTWKKAGAATFVDAAAPWYAQVVCDATLWVEGDRLRFAFGGGDAARPDEEIHGMLGTGFAPLP